MNEERSLYPSFYRHSVNLTTIRHQTSANSIASTTLPPRVLTVICSSNNHNQPPFLDTQVSLAPTHVRLSVCKSVGPLVTLSDFQSLVALSEK